MGVDLLILDHNATFCKHIQLAAEAQGLGVATFGDGVEALRYVRGRTGEELPRAYFVHAFLPGGDDEKRAPVEIYNHVKRHGPVDSFYFWADLVDPAAHRLAESTGASLLDKRNVETILGIVEELAKRRRE